MGKHYDVVKDVAYLLASGLREQKAARVERRIVTWVFDAPQAMRSERMMAVATALENIYQRIADGHRKGTLLLARISETLFVHEEYASLMSLFFRAFTSSKGARAMVRDATTRMDVIAHPSLTQRAAAWLLLEVFRVAGATLDNAIAFALFLLEDLAQHTQRQVQEKAGECVPLQPTNRFDAFLVIAACAMAHPVTPSTQKRWIEQLIEHAAENHAASETLFSIYNVLVSARDDFRITLEGVAFPTERREEGEMILSFPQRLVMQNIPLRLFLRHVHLFGRWYETAQRIPDTEFRQGVELFAWCATHHDAITETKKVRCRAIQDHPRRWLRPHGLDHIEVRVSTLYDIGIRALAFYPEGEVFPDTKIHIITKKETPHCIVFPATLRNFVLTCDPYALRHGNERYRNAPILHELLEHVIIDILWRLVTRERTLQLKNGHDATPAEHAAGGAPHHVAVGPMIRRLPDGYHATDHARTLAGQIGWQLPEGYTFQRDYQCWVVPATYAGGRIVHALPTEPFAVYGDDDFMALTDPI